MNSLLFLSQLRNTLLLQYSGRCFDAEQSECECITSPADLTYPQVSFSQPKTKVPFPPLITHFVSSLKDVHLVLSSPSLQTSPLSLLSRQLWAQTLRLQDASDRFKTTQNLFEDIVIAMMDGKADVSLLQEAILHDASLLHKAYNLFIPTSGIDEKEEGLEAFGSNRNAKRANSNFLNLWRRLEAVMCSFKAKRNSKQEVAASASASQALTLEGFSSQNAMRGGGRGGSD